MNPDVVKLCEAVRNAGGRAMLVGGCVRDQLIGVESKDLDVEVYGLEPSSLRDILERFGQVNTVGEQFSVYKVVLPQSTERSERLEIDVSIPRRESKSGRGHRSFHITGDPTMSFEEAARRRDFTINAILYDPLLDERADPYHGEQDFKNRVLRAVSEDTFAEDSLRVLRAVQLAARFEMTIDDRTIQLCRGIDLSDLPHERIWAEIEKLLMMAERPSIGLSAAHELGVLDKLFPEILSLAGRQSEHEAEDAFEHTKLAVDQAVELSRELSKGRRVTVMLATLCHDFVDRQKSAGTLMNKLGVYTIGGYDVRSQVLSLVAEQGTPRRFYENRARTMGGEFRRLARHTELDLLYRLSKACALGKRAGANSEAEDWFIERARALGVEHRAPDPLLLGRHLIDAGIEPGPQMGQLLKQVYEKQLDGEVTTQEEALAEALRRR